MIGWPALFHPLGGYLNTLSRLVAAFAVNFPLVAAPAIYLAFAAFFQLLPVALMLSRRMDAALPSWPARLALVYSYAAMPNSYELNLNLTNAQWHLAIAAFLILAGSPATGRIARATDLSLLTLSGLSGPFGIFLVPIAGLDSWRRRHISAPAAIVTATAAVQLGLILASHATSARLAAPLGATFSGFVKIVTVQIILGGTIGYRATWLLLQSWHSASMLLLLLIAAATAAATALRIGPPIYRQGAFWAACLFTAALITPLSAATTTQWAEMTHAGATIRYYVIPTMIWFATWLILVTSPWPVARSVSYLVLALMLFGIRFDWQYPPFHPTDFQSQARKFDSALPGYAAVFAENPPGWKMALVKK
jgi:hypothetical protein